MPYLQQVVLQRERQWNVDPYRQSPGPSETQGGSATSRVSSGGYSFGVLQLRNKECLLVGIYPRQVGYSCGAPVSPAMCIKHLNQGYELGYIAMGATH